MKRLKMGMRDTNHKLTICEVLRMANDKVQGPEHSDVRDLLALAEHMAKRMSKRMAELNETMEKGWWEDNPAYKETMNRVTDTYLIGSPDRARQVLERLVHG